MLRFGLESAGFSVSTYDSGPDGLTALLALPTKGLPRLVLLAVDLPGMDGHTLHEQLQQARPGRFIVVFLSNRDSDTDQLRALNAGAVDYLVTPVSIPVLIVKVDKWLRARGPA
jgi:DNA-binding response OmpR family regulator